MRCLTVRLSAVVEKRADKTARMNGERKYLGRKMLFGDWDGRRQAPSETAFRRLSPVALTALYVLHGTHCTPWLQDGRRRRRWFSVQSPDVVFITLDAQRSHCRQGFSGQTSVLTRTVTNDALIIVQRTWWL